MQVYTYGFGSSGDKVSGLYILEHALGTAGKYVCSGSIELVSSSVSLRFYTVFMLPYVSH